MPEPIPSPQPVSRTPWSRRLFRRIKSSALRPEPVYRLYLKLKFGTGRPAAVPESPLPNGVLKSRAEWQQAFDAAKAARLPLHRGEEKNWDHLAAAFAILGSTTSSARVLDAGAEFYSNVLPTLFAYGYRNLYGINLSFTEEARRGPIRYLPGDITRTIFADGYFDAVACMSVIEHGVPLDGYFREMHRVLKPGGLLITSTDYYPTAIDTEGGMAHGAAIKVFTKAEIQEILRLAEQIGFESTGEVDLECSERPVRWEQFNLDYSFLIFTLRKPTAS
ncbi:MULTISPECIES: class I SAM-dependent methyltransferase [Acidobacteriaceae]|uniref:class I SAM-dependent methyltransferase n=1 Tax=Acidobacteriaceae TaxID=204434 RepID=UPI00131DEAB7|nr:MULTISPECIES: class I SAM-dependent methyltransferase [Acidobacteriaceae]MDW5265773.1 class I SAM-dependent methyltransferase [Edaphobacter sp.]